MGAVETFLAAFFRPHNIRVMLLVGAGIVFASSLMLVTKSWGDWPTWIQYLTVVVYTGGIYLASLSCRRHLQLPATARVLASLSLLLLPILFHALAWVSPGTALQWMAFFALAVPSLALLFVVAPRILDDWMGQRQTTFLFCFTALSIAGCLPVLTHCVAAIVATAVFWVLFTAGSLKCNRLAFWMAQSDRRPREFAFVPIAILGTMFITLMVTKTINVIPTNSLSIAIMMAAGTILWTSRGFAAAVRQRTGDLIRPLPMEIVVPLAIGLVMTGIAVVTSFSGFSLAGPTTYSVIPTALLGCVILATVAWDLHDRVLTIASILCGLITYQCCPVLFSDLVHAVRDGAAGVIHRDRIPLSMYGLTYVPVLITLIVMAAKLATTTRHRLSSAVERFAVGTATLLIALSLLDTLSACLVSVVMAGLAWACSRLFSSGYYKYAALALATVTVGSVIPSGNQLRWWTIANDWTLVLLAAEAIYLLLKTRHRPIHYAAVIAVACLVTCWISQSINTLGQSPSIASIIHPFVLMIGGLVYAAVHQGRRVADACWILAGLILARFIAASSLPIAELTTNVVAGLLIVQVLASLTNCFLKFNSLSKRTGVSIVCRSLDDLTLILLAAISVCLSVPTLAAIHWASLFGIGGFSWLQHSRVAFALLAGLLVTLIKGIHDEQDAVARFSKISLTLMAPLIATALCVSLGVVLSWTMTVLIWAATTATMQWRGRADGQSYLDAIWPVLITIISLTDFGYPVRAAAALVLVNPLLNGDSKQRMTSLLFVAVQIMMTAAALVGCRGWSEVTTPMLVVALSTTGVIALTAGEVLGKMNPANSFDRLLRLMADGFTAAAVGIGSVSLLHPSTIDSVTPVAMLMGAGVCSYQAWIRCRSDYIIAAIVTLNLALFSVCLATGWTATELFTLPIGVSILAVTGWLGDRMGNRASEIARYCAVILMMASPLPQMIGGSWAHAAIVLAISVGLILASIGLRVRALMIAGSIGLGVDLTIMVIRTSMGHTTLMWLWGMGIGIGVLLLAAYCERHRERLLSRVRILSAELATWN